MQLIDAAIFDLDGTLFESRINYEKLSALIAEILRAHGYRGPLLDPRVVHRVIQFGEKERIEEGLTGHSLRLALRDIDQAMSRVELEALPTNTLRPHARETIQTLHRSGIKLGIITGSHREYTVRSLQAEDLSAYFTAVVARDDTSTPKPHPNHLHQAINQLGADKARTMYVGDSITDLETADAASVTFIGYWRDEQRAQTLLDAGCKIFVRDLKELVALAGVSHHLY